MNASCKPSLGAPSYSVKISQAENGQKVDDFEPICISVNTDFDGKRFVIFEHAINRICFGNVCLPQPEYYFSFFFLLVTFFFQFFVSSPVVYF